ncbi:hypothetical protein C0W35_20995, partial [Photobacterium kishitanii]|uniref:hypothetical protein n=1 Tax=Photobacterium kishitanii TaxID=318456 RepID=UPI000D4F2265
LVNMKINYKNKYICGISSIGRASEQVDFIYSNVSKEKYQYNYNNKIDLCSNCENKYMVSKKVYEEKANKCTSNYSLD